MPANVMFYDAIWDAMYLLILLAFFVASILFALATWRGHGRLTKVLSFFYVGAAFITLDFISGELNGPTIPATISFWLYPALQPIARTLIGVWLWRQRDAD